MASNAGERLQFRFAVHVHWPGVAELGSFGRKKKLHHWRERKETNMKSKIQMKSLLLGLVLGAAAVFLIGAAASGGRTDWEYRVVSGLTFHRPDPPILEKSINSSVAEGWEFVSASGTSQEHGFAIMRRKKK